MMLKTYNTLLLLIKYLTILFKNQKLLVVSGVILLSGCQKTDTIRVLKLGHGLNTNHPVHKAMVILGEELKKESNGKMEVRIYPSGQLGRERECLELLQIGSLDITKVSAAVVENFIPEYKVFSIPYLFKDRQHTFDVFDGDIGTSLLLKGEKFRLRGLTFYDAGTRNFYMKQDFIASPKDLINKKIRVQKSNMAVAMINDLGGSPATISFGDLYSSLQQGVVDGAENNIPSYFTSKHYEVCKYLSVSEHAVVPDVLLIGINTWNQLNEQERKWLQYAVNKSTVAQRQLWEASEKESLNKVIASGVKVIYPDRAPFREMTKAIADMFKDNEEMTRIINAIKKLE